MRAALRERYGSPDVVQVREVEAPALTDDGVLVRVHASSVNAGDWYVLTGTPYVGRPTMGFLKPKQPVLGGDIAGTVEAVGKDVTDLRPGDEVYGGKSGAYAEVVCARRRAIARKPANLTFEEAAAVPIAALTALQGLRDHGKLAPGQKVLVNGASGGVGTFAVQIAKALGAEVTAVCSTKNVDLVRSLGADRVVDYTREDFTRSGERYDVLLDVAGSRSWRACKRVLAPDARLVLVGAPKGTRLLGPLSHILAVRLGAFRSSRTVVFFIAKLNEADLDTVRELIETGKVEPVVERRYPLGEAADALRRFGEGHVQGKLVVAIPQ